MRVGAIFGEVHAQAEDVLRHHASQERPPRARRRRGFGGRGIDAALTPGLTHRPMRMPAMTEISDVAANHSSVDTARRAALVTLRRFATDVMTA